jgi:hypothetical protein
MSMFLLAILVKTKLRQGMDAGCVVWPHNILALLALYLVIIVSLVLTYYRFYRDLNVVLGVECAGSK